jgi:hypothetical protein
MKKQRIARAGLSGLMAAGILAGAAPAFARGGGGGMQASGSCSAASQWKLSAKADDGRIEAEFEVDQNVVGDTWKVLLKDNGVTFFKGQRVTKAPSGSFEVKRFTADRAGSDTISARAKNLSTGETCAGSVTV